LYDWRMRKRVPRAVKVGRHLRYRPEDVERWLDERTAA
ncbi:MAG: helix-turn-helix domain-containing protein, partial [Dermatophilaceae bacterium]|nr:helix-turn-helix domain-containing protein [Dermatophilaceae bacterium]